MSSLSAVCLEIGDGVDLYLREDANGYERAEVSDDQQKSVYFSMNREEVATLIRALSFLHSEMADLSQGYKIKLETDGE